MTTSTAASGRENNTAAKSHPLGCCPVCWHEPPHHSRTCPNRGGDGMTSEEIDLAEFFGPPDFLLAAEQFDAENGAGAAAELLRLAKENSRG